MTAGFAAVAVTPALGAVALAADTPAAVVYVLAAAATVLEDTEPREVAPRLAAEAVAREPDSLQAWRAFRTIAIAPSNASANGINRSPLTGTPRSNVSAAIAWTITPGITPHWGVP